MKRLLSVLLFLLPGFIHADSQVIPRFRGLNNAETSVLIGDDEAQDIQDVDITESGMGIKKRRGYDQFKTIGISTWAVRGGHYFRNTSGADLIIHANSRSVLKSATGGNYSAFVTTDTNGSYYDFTDSQGYLWRANSNRDEIFRYDGSAVTYYPSTPKGDQIEVLPDRLAISGTSANPNRINFSAAADFTTFTTGTDEGDPYTEDIGLPGQKINAIKVACGNNLLSWTRDTTSIYSGTNQYDGVIDQVSNTIGTLQPNSVIQDYGVTYWQGQDKHFYSFDCNTVSKLSRKLDVSNFAGGESKLWEQTAQSDWQAGTLSELSATLSVGDVQLSTWTDTDTTDAQFNGGAASNTSVYSDRIYLSTSNTNIDDSSINDSAQWTVTNSGVGFGSVSGGKFRAACTAGIVSNFLYKIVDTSGNELSSLYNFGAPLFNTCPSYTTAINLGTLGANVGRWVKLKIEGTCADGGGTYATSTPFIASGGRLNVTACNETSSLLTTTYIDISSAGVGGRSDVYSGTFTSAAFDTTLSSSAWLSSNATWTTNGHAITMQTQSSTDGSSWDTAVAWSTGSAPTSLWKRYIRNVVTISTGGTTNGTALPYVDDVTFSARNATGTFVSQTKNIGGNATAFRNFTATDDSDSGTIAYFIRTATTEGGLTSASYTSMTKDAQISASINPWIQVKATFTITAATQDPTLSNFIVNWDEGAIIRTFGTVDKDHRLMWSVAEGTNTVPNATFIYDPRFDSWLRYAVPFDAPARVGDSIYFGGVSTGVVYNWPSGDNDQGGAITAYWKSKDFIGGDPFVEKDFVSYSFLGDTEAGSNLDITFTVNASSTVTNNHSLTDVNSLPFRRINANFPSGKAGTFINFKFGNDDANAPFEIYGFKYDYRIRPWRVLQ